MQVVPLKSFGGWITVPSEEVSDRLSSQSAPCWESQVQPEAEQAAKNKLSSQGHRLLCLAGGLCWTSGSCSSGCSAPEFKRDGGEDLFPQVFLWQL